LPDHAPKRSSAFLKRADKAVVKAPVASNRSSRVIKVINVALNKLSPLFGLVIYLLGGSLMKILKIEWKKL
jgi:hypothetical protein